MDHMLETDAQPLEFGSSDLNSVNIFIVKLYVIVLTDLKKDFESVERCGTCSGDGTGDAPGKQVAPPHTALHLCLSEVVGYDQVFADVDRSGVTPAVHQIGQTGGRVKDQVVAPLVEVDLKSAVPFDSLDQSDHFLVRQVNAQPFECMRHFIDVYHSVLIGVDVLQ